MSESLSIRCEWLDQPCAADPLERRTWGCIRMQTGGGRRITRVFDRSAKSEHEGLDIPAYPVARWIIANWWALLYEPCRTETIPLASPEMKDETRQWIDRHCLRAAESGLLLPRLFIFNDGRRICLRWFSDEEDAFPSMPAQFVEDGCAYVERDEARRALGDFLCNVLDRVESFNDPRSLALQRNWKAIVNADSAESDFCAAAGRMGLDPYTSGGWNAPLLSLIETGLGEDLSSPLVVDFLETTDSDHAPSEWEWVAETTHGLDLERRQAEHPAAPSSPVAAKTGYARAADCRRMANLGSEQYLGSVQDAARAMGLPSLDIVDHNHLSTRHFNAAVGWKAGRQPLIAGPMPKVPYNRRFLEARGLYHAAFGCGQTPRLVSAARTWDQQASRAFAAELLIPREVVRSRIPANADMDEKGDLIVQLSQDFGVSTMVVQHQLDNA